MKFILLFYEFFKIGLFSVGGGLATLPFLFYLTQKYDWFTSNELMMMLGVSSVTPGPIGLNMATFAGFKTAGIFGSLIATSAIVLPSLINVIILSKLLNKYCDNFYLKTLLYSLKPAGCALLSCVLIDLFCNSIFNNASINSVNFENFFVFIVFLLLSLILKKGPIFLIILSAILGCLKTFFNDTSLIPIILQ